MVSSLNITNDVVEPGSKRQKIDDDSSGSRRRSSRVSYAIDYSIKNASRTSVGETVPQNKKPSIHRPDPSTPSRPVEPIAAKKHELNQIVDRHDNNVRLLFHLEKFVSLVYYDPKDAKNDTSDVFELYRQKYDLWANTNTGGGRSRHTRRQLQETQHIYEEPKPAPRIPPKIKEEVIAASTLSPSPSKHKSKHTSKSSLKRPAPAPASPSSTKQRPKPLKPSKPSKPTKTDQKLVKPPVEEPIENEMTWDELFPYQPDGIVMNIPDPLSDDDEDDKDTVDNEPLPRLKFTFTLPKQNVTHPSHLVAEPPYGGSLESYLASFFAIDQVDMSKRERDEYISEQIDIRHRIKDAKLKGIITEDGYTSSEVNEMQKFVDPGKVPTHQDHVSAQSVYFARLMKDERKAHMSQARKIAQMVESYFKRLSGAEERERKAQEKAIRQLAKRTVLEVMKKWKLAEKVVRQRRLKILEEEQRVQGKLHLNQILENSAKLLEARIEDQSILNQNFDSDSDDESTASQSAEEVDGSDDDDDDGQSDAESLASDEMSSDSEEESEEESVKAGDDQLTVEQLRDKYSGIQEEDQVDEEEEEEIELDERAQALYEEEANNGAEDSDESVPMDSEDDSDELSTEDGRSDEESEDEEEDSKSSGLAALFSTRNLADNDSDDEDVSIEDEEDHGKVEDTPSSTPEGHESHEVVESQNVPADKRPHVRTPFLLRGTLREYQHDGLDWLVGLYNNQTNGILADEMGLGKTIQTIALLSYLACEKEVWGPHLIVVPTSVMLNWEMEFKRFAPGFKVLTYYGNPQQRKEKRRGWNKDNTFHVCITSYQLVLQDQHAFKRKKWHYLILDEAHNIKNFRSQRWQALLNFNSERRLLLTGTPLQNNLVELWSLLYFLMPSSRGTASMPEGFANLQDFQEWFARPVDRMVEEGGQIADEETRQTVAKLHQILRPYLLRRLKADVEKQMPGKYEHIVYCRLSNRQRYLYDDFMSRAQTRETLSSGNFLSIINCLMQLRKVCNHPDLFEVRPIVTSLALQKSVPSLLASDLSYFDNMLENRDESVNLSALNLLLSANESMSQFDYQAIQQSRAHRAMAMELTALSVHGRPIKPDFHSIKGHSRYWQYLETYNKAKDIQHCLYLNIFRCARRPIYGADLRNLVNIMDNKKRLATDGYDWKQMSAMKEMCKTYTQRETSVADIITRYSFVTPKVLYLDMPETTLGKQIAEDVAYDADRQITASRWDQSLFHESQVRLSIAFPDKRLLQYDCGKLQRLAILLRDLTAEGHRALIFTQMTRVLDILEQFLNMHGYRYMRLDGATKVEQRQALTERFNNDAKIPVFILSSRSGGLGINLTGADTVIFYDSDWNPSMDKQCQDRCHRIGQTRDVHIYRFVSEFTIESNILKKATQKTILDNVVIQDGEFTTDYFNKLTVRDMIGDIANDAAADKNAMLDKTMIEDTNNIEKTLAQAEDADDAAAANIALREENAEMEDFDVDKEKDGATRSSTAGASASPMPNEEERDSTGVDGNMKVDDEEKEEELARDDEQDDEFDDDDTGHVDEYMIKFIEDGYYGDI